MERNNYVSLNIDVNIIFRNIIAIMHFVKNNSNNKNLRGITFFANNKTYVFEEPYLMFCVQLQYTSTLFQMKIDS